MKVLMFGWEFPPHISGGLGTACYGLTKGLSKFNDVEVLFVVPKKFGDEDTSAASIIGASDIHVSQRNISIRGFGKELNLLEVDSMLIPYADPDEYFRLIKKYETHNQHIVMGDFEGHFNFAGGYGVNLYSEILNYSIVASAIALENQFDVIHAHDWLTYPAGIAAKEISGKPLVIHVHATDFDRSGGNVNPRVYEIEKRGMEIADKIITVSNWTRDIVINKYGIDPAKVITVYNAVEPISEIDKIAIRKGIDDKIVTFLGRITMQKGPEYFVEAAKKVLKKMDNVRFVMAGSGDMMNKMITRVAKLGISNRFHFTGFLSGDDVYSMYSISDVYVMPSVSEPFGISPLEAIQSNVPVIISRQSGVAEVLNHAIKIDFWDIDAMADAIYGILNYPALSNMFKIYGKQEVDNLKWETSASRVRDIYYAATSKQLIS
jgi:glycosyltransferase involved in cell wall biosynthesis